MTEFYLKFVLIHALNFFGLDTKIIERLFLAGIIPFEADFLAPAFHELAQGRNCLAETPYVGRHRPDVKEGDFSCIQGAHVIFYLIRENGIDIIGVPHQRMDILNYFSTTNH